MANESATMSLPMDLIKPAINAHVAAGISAALGSADAIVAKLIKEVMNRTVDGRGEPSTYRDAKPWIEWIAESMIREAIKDGMQLAIDERKAEISAMISKSMRDVKSDFHKKILTAAADGISNSLANSYSVNIEFKAR